MPKKKLSVEKKQNREREREALSSLFFLCSHSDRLILAFALLPDRAYRMRVYWNIFLWMIRRPVKRVVSEWVIYFMKIVVLCDVKFERNKLSFFCIFLFFLFFK